MAEWGNPPGGHASGTPAARQESEPGDLKHLSTRRRRNQVEITRVAASETVRSLNRGPCDLGVEGPTDGTSEATRSPLERGPRDGERPVAEGDALVLVEFLSSARYEEPGVKLGGPPSKAEDSRVTDSGQGP
jgi:hypothetical protein